jgi:hypothetical protein
MKTPTDSTYDQDARELWIIVTIGESSEEGTSLHFSTQGRDVYSIGGEDNLVPTKVGTADTAAKTMVLSLYGAKVYDPDGNDRLVHGLVGIPVKYSIWGEYSVFYPEPCGQDGDEST